MHTLTLVTLLAACSSLAAPTNLSSQTRAQQVAAAFSKRSDAVKDKHGVRMEKYKDVRSEPLLKADITEYGGVYQVADLGDAMDLRIGRDGTIEASGHDADRGSRAFVLENGRIASAVLTGIKAYSDGTREPFEGVFMTRTVRESRTDPGTATRGLGVMLAVPREFGGNTYDRLFFALRP